MKLYISLLTELPGLPWWLSSNLPANAGDSGSTPGLGRSKGKLQPIPVFLPRESHRQRSLVGYSPWNRKIVRQDWATKTTITDRVMGRKRCPSRLFPQKDALSLYFIQLVSSPVDRHLEHYIPSPTQGIPKPLPQHPHIFQSQGSPTQTSLGHQCSWTQACRLAPGFPALEVAPGGCGPEARPATPPPLCSRSVTSGPTARQSPYPLPSYAAPPVLCTLDPRTTHKPGERKTATSGQHLGVLTPCVLGSGTQELSATNCILWLIFSSHICSWVLASYLNIQTSQSGSVLNETNLYKFFRRRAQKYQFLKLLFLNVESIYN